MSENKNPQVFIDISAAELSQKSADYLERGWRFVNLCGSSVPQGVELIYTFSDGYPMENLRFVIDSNCQVESISELYPNAFFFENETHDLFGTSFTGISIDFDGNFYKVSVPTPMNPQSNQAKAAANIDVTVKESDNMAAAKEAADTVAAEQASATQGKEN